MALERTKGFVGGIGSRVGAGLLGQAAPVKGTIAQPVTDHPVFGGVQSIIAPRHAQPVTFIQARTHPVGLPIETNRTGSLS